jgi:hypothetical protein
MTQQESAEQEMIEAIDQWRRDPMTDKTDTDPAVEAAIKEDDGLFALGMLAITDSDSILESCEKLYARTLEQKAKIQEQAKEIARLHDELTCEFCEKEAGPENPCVCLDCHGKG